MKLKAYLYSLLYEIGKKRFFLRYKLRLAKEGRDFFTCGEYDFCKKCIKGKNQPCKKYYK